MSNALIVGAAPVAPGAVDLFSSAAAALPGVDRELLREGLKAVATIAVPGAGAVTDAAVAVATEVPVKSALTGLDAAIIDPSHPVSATSLLRDTAREHAHAVHTSAELANEKRGRDRSAHVSADPGGQPNHHARRKETFGL